MNDDTIHTGGYIREVGPRTKLDADKPHLSRNMNGDLLLIDGEKRSIVATSFSALWYAIIAFGDGGQAGSTAPLAPEVVRPTAARQPLSADDIARIAERMEASDPTDSFWRNFARAIEAEHGIKGV